MKSTYLMLLASALLLMSINSCCKDPGDGGDAKLLIQLKHHDKLIQSVSDSLPGYPQGYSNAVYIKYDAEESPGTDPAAYDKVITGGAHADHLHIEGLKCGKYFIYATGYDKDINSVVKGGIPIKIKYKNRKQEITVDVPVTE